MKLDTKKVIKADDGLIFIGIAREDEGRCVSFVTGFEASFSAEFGWSVNLSEDEDEPDWCRVHAVASVPISTNVEELNV